MKDNENEFLTVRMDGRTDGRTDEQKSPCVVQDFVPFGAAAQKADFRPDRADFRLEMLISGLGGLF